MDEAELTRLGWVPVDTEGPRRGFEAKALVRWCLTRAVPVLSVGRLRYVRPADLDAFADKLDRMPRATAKRGLSDVHVLKDRLGRR